MAENQSFFSKCNSFYQWKFTQIRLKRIPRLSLQAVEAQRPTCCYSTKFPLQQRQSSSHSFTIHFAFSTLTEQQKGHLHSLKVDILHMKIVTTLPWAITLDINCIFPGETKIEWSLPPTLLQHPELQPSIKLGQFLFVHLREEKMENNKCWEKRREWKNMEKP